MINVSGKEIFAVNSVMIVLAISIILYSEIDFKNSLNKKEKQSTEKIEINKTLSEAKEEAKKIADKAQKDAKAIIFNAKKEAENIAAREREEAEKIAKKEKERYEKLKKTRQKERDKMATREKKDAEKLAIKKSNENLEKTADKESEEAKNDEEKTTNTDDGESNEYKIHLVEKGESLYSISQQYGVPIDILIYHNKSYKEDKNSIDIGDEIVIPEYLE